jgi:hypothetical protein
MLLMIENIGRNLTQMTLSGPLLKRSRESLSYFMKLFLKFLK